MASSVVVVSNYVTGPTPFAAGRDAARWISCPSFHSSKPSSFFLAVRQVVFSPQNRTELSSFGSKAIHEITSGSRTLQIIFKLSTLPLSMIIPLKFKLIILNSKTMLSSLSTRFINFTWDRLCIGAAGLKHVEA